MFDCDTIQKQREQVELSKVSFWHHFRARLWKPIIWLFGLLSAVNTLLDLCDHWEQWQPQLQELYIAFRAVVVSPAITSLQRFALSLRSVLLRFAGTFVEGAILIPWLFGWALLFADTLLLIYAQIRDKQYSQAFSETVIRESLASLLLHRKSDGAVGITRRGVAVAVATTLAVGICTRTIIPINPQDFTPPNLQELPFWKGLYLIFLIFFLLSPYLAVLWRFSRTYPPAIERGLGLSLLSPDLWNLDPQKVEQFTCRDAERRHFKTCARAFRICFMEDNFNRIYGIWQLDYDLKADKLRMYAYVVWSGNTHKLPTVVWAMYDDKDKNKWCIVDCAIGFDSQDWNIINLRSPHRKRSWPKLGHAFVGRPRKDGRWEFVTGLSNMHEELLWQMMPPSRVFPGISDEQFDRAMRKREAQKQ